MQNICVFRKLYYFCDEIINDHYLGYLLFQSRIQVSIKKHSVKRTVNNNFHLPEISLKLINTRKMKTTSTSIRKALFALLFTLNFIGVKAQCVAPAMVFKNPVVIYGTAGEIGAQYKFPAVTPGVDAVFTILDKVGGATLTSIDDLTYGYSNAWQPVVKTPVTQGAGESYVSFRLDFLDAATGSYHQYNCFVLSFIDVDGDNEHVREFVETKNYDSYTTAGNTLLQMTNNNAFMRALGPVANYEGLDTSAYVTNINYNFSNKNKINEIRIGNKVDASFTVQDRYTCGYFQQITIPSVVLAVKYSSFTSSVLDKTISLQWTTEQEINTDHFEVERSFDGVDFKTAGLVMGAINAYSISKTYTFKDNAIELLDKKIVYYRIKEIDKNGKSSNSNILAVRLQAKNSDLKIQVSPNPFAENLNFQFTSQESGIAQVQIISATGQKAMTQQTVLNKGYNTIQIQSLNKLSPGIYIAQLMLNGVVIGNQKIIKN